MAFSRSLVVLLLLATLIVTGCWDRREPELLAFVLAVGLDKGPTTGEYKIVAQIHNPLAMTQEMGGGGGQKNRLGWWRPQGELLMRPGKTWLLRATGSYSGLIPAYYY